MNRISNTSISFHIPQTQILKSVPQTEIPYRNTKVSRQLLRQAVALKPWWYQPTAGQAWNYCARQCKPMPICSFPPSKIPPISLDNVQADCQNGETEDTLHSHFSCRLLVSLYKTGMATNPAIYLGVKHCYEEKEEVISATIWFIESL